MANYTNYTEPAPFEKIEAPAVTENKVKKWFVAGAIIVSAALLIVAVAADEIARQNADETTEAPETVTPDPAELEAQWNKIFGKEE